jgi:RimJ/RimL family protein N-acetyltransferase
MTEAAEQLHTERLVLERLTPEHEPDVARILQDPLVAAMLSDDGRPPSREQVHAQHLAKLEHWERFGFGLWAARDRTTGALIGRGGLQHAFAKGLHEVEAAWTIASERWGEGLATELADACVQVGLTSLGLRRVIALTTADNTASRRVMEKAGFHFARTMRELRPSLVLYIRPGC